MNDNVENSAMLLPRLAVSDLYPDQLALCSDSVDSSVGSSVDDNVDNSVENSAMLLPGLTVADLIPNSQPTWLV